METWRDIPGFGDGYQASDAGRIRSKDRVVSSGARWKSRVLSGSVNGRGYRMVKLCFSGKKRLCQVHRLIMLAFRGPSSLTVDHINGNKTDNRLENLEYVSCGENIRRYKRKVDRGGLPMYVHRADNNRFRALYTRGRKVRKHLGYFRTPEEAKQAVDVYLRSAG